jgi:hypothetical protein
MSKDGGPAFPELDARTMLSGMSLRDYFAAMALQGILNDADAFWDEAARLAYQYADAMLKAREK